MLQKILPKYICIYMQSQWSNTSLSQIINTLVLIRITNTLGNPVLFSTLTLMNNKGLLLTFYWTGLYPKILQMFLEVKYNNKTTKMYNMPFRIRSIREYCSSVWFKIKADPKKSLDLHIFPNHLMSTHGALLLFSFVTQISFNPEETTIYSGGKCASIFLQSLQLGQVFAVLSSNCQRL